MNSKKEVAANKNHRPDSPVKTGDLKKDVTPLVNHQWRPGEKMIGTKEYMQKDKKSLKDSPSNQRV